MVCQERQWGPDLLYQSLHVLVGSLGCIIQLHDDLVTCKELILFNIILTVFSSGCTSSPESRFIMLIYTVLRYVMHLCA